MPNIAEALRATETARSSREHEEAMALGDATDPVLRARAEEATSVVEMTSPIWPAATRSRI